MADDKTLGQIAFEAYVQQVRGVTYDLKPIPTWDHLTDSVRAGWEVAAIAMMTRVVNGPPKDDSLPKKEEV